MRHRHRAEKRGIRRRLKGRPRGDVLLFTDWTLLRLFPPLRAAWSRVGEQARVPVTGRNAKRVLFGAINIHTGHRVVLCRKSAGGADAQAFLLEWRRHYRKAPTIRLLLDRAPAHTDGRTLRLAMELGIELVWLPRQVARTERHGPCVEGVETAHSRQVASGQHRRASRGSSRVGTPTPSTRSPAQSRYPLPHLLATRRMTKLLANFSLEFAISRGCRRGRGCSE